MSEVPVWDGSKVRLRLRDDGTLEAVCGARRVEGASTVLGAPLTRPDAWASLVKDGREAAVLTNLGALDPDSRAALERAKRERYLTARVLAIEGLDDQFGATYWRVRTDKGPREFVLKGLSHHVRWLSPDRFIVTDVDGNRFEVPDRNALDDKSRRLLDLVL